ncbi:MAG: hypothetical protein ABUL60_24190 [Myxococcales bacterium]
MSTTRTNWRGWFRAALWLLIATSTAHAGAAASLPDARGLDVRLFRPPVDPDGYLHSNGTACLQPGALGLRLTLDAGFGLVPVEHAATGALALNLGILDGLVAGVALPLQRVSGDASSSTGVGDVELSGKYRLLQLQPGDLQTTARPGLAAVLRVSAPTGNAGELRGEPGLSIWPTIVLDYAPLPQLRFGAEAGYRFISGRGAALPLQGNPRFDYDDLITLGLAGRVDVSHRLSFLADWYAAGVAPSLTTRGAISAEIAGGARYQLNSYISLTAGAAFGLPRGQLASTGRGFLSLVVAASDADLDRDGYVTRVDGCPDRAEDFDGFRDGDGCPDEDNDADGVDDAVDACPDDAGARANAGCPVRVIGDRDRDGVNDYLDDCPDVAASGTTTGCPAARKTGDGS